MSTGKCAGTRAGIAAAGGDRGFASVMVLAAGAVVVAIATTAMLAGAATIARHQAQSAADFGALAGAARAELQPDEACAAAQEVVEANHATMSACHLDGITLVVTATVDVTDAPPGIGPATAIARASPVQEPLEP